MADTDDSQAEPEPESPPEPETDATTDAEDAPESDVGRTELKVMRARLSLEEEAEAARRRVLGPRRGRARPARVPAAGDDDEDDADLSERLRDLVRGVEEETERLQDDV